MSDVLEGGPQRPPLPPWVRGAAAVAVLVAVGAYGVTEARKGAPDPPPAAPVPSAPPGGTAPEGAGWRVREGGCGVPVVVPRTMAASGGRSTGLRLLAGGARLSRVDFDTGAVAAVPGVGEGSQVSSVVASGSTAYVRVTDGCQAPFPPSTLMRMSGRPQPRAVPVPGDVDDLIAGAGQVWVVDHPEGRSVPVTVRPPGGRALPLPAGASPAGVAEAGIVAVSMRSGNSTGSAITLVDRVSGEAETLVPDGRALAVGRDVVLWREPGCDRGAGTCVLRASGVPGGADRGRYPLPAGRVPLPDAVLDGSGRLAAFPLTRPGRQGTSWIDQPGPPADVAVLDLHTRRLQFVPDLVLAADSDVGLAFSPDGRWLVLSVNHGDHGHLFAWRRGADRLVRSPARLPGPLVSAPPVVVLPDGAG
jgi:hypothetical protein